MTIKFTKRNGETVETADKNVFFESVKSGDVLPDSIIEVDGRFAKASQVRGAEFPIFAVEPIAAPAPAVAPPTAEPETEPTVAMPAKIVTAFTSLRGIVYILGAIAALGGAATAINALDGPEVAKQMGVMVGIAGVLWGATIGAVGHFTLDILEFIVRSLPKK